MPPILPRFLETHASRLEHAKKLERIARESDGIVDPDGKKYYHDPGDSRTLRGIPAVGRGVAGVIPGTNPSSIG